MPLVAMPDGAQVQFPDDMQPDQIKSMILQKFPDAGKPQSTAAAVGDYATTLAKNIPGSAAQFATDIVQPIIHPIETVENVGKIGKGVLQKFGVVSGDDHTKYADAVGKFFADRYGGWDNVKKTLRDDPVGALADLSTVLTAGGSTAARAPGMLGKVGEIAATAGRVVDPLSAVAAVAKPIGKLATETVGGLTGTGGKSLELAAQAGAAGGETAMAFKDSLRGNTPIAEVVGDARGALGKLRQERGTVYREGMDALRRSDSALGIENQILDFNKIDAAVARVAGVKNFKGQDISPTTKDIRADITKTIDDWKALAPAEFHTAEGLDALKQKIGDIRDGTQVGTPERLIADQTYHAIKNTIVAQAPEYAKVMKGYEEASSIIQEIEKTLSLKKSASVDASVRKLQSVLRNNVNTNYGNRAALADYLVSVGAPHLLSKLAGQSLNTWTPRGLGHVTGAGELMFALHELMNGNPKAAAAIGAMIPASSPRLAGEVAYGLGAASRVAKPAASSAFQLGRADRALQ